MSSIRRQRRVAMTLAPSERDALGEIARRAREPEATTAARLLRAALADHGAIREAALRRRPTLPVSIASPDRDGAAWLPPSVRAEAIDALRDRYPHELHRLPAEALSDAIVAEQIAALSVWREQIDAGNHSDPRMELAFAHELLNFASWLQTRSRRNR